jgi:predicted DNA-binding protein (MmcQ/YjbR family)
MPRRSLLDRVRRFCAAWPDVEESSRLGGEPHFYVRGKIFAGVGDEHGGPCVGMKVGLELQSLLVERDGIHVAKYVGKHGWITVEERALQDDDELERLLRISYDLIAAGAPKVKAKAAKAKTVAKKKAVTKRRSPKG